MRYWLSLHPDVTRPVGGVKQMHRLAEAIQASGRQATLIQDLPEFHPGWFKSTVKTISFSNWKKLRDTELSPCNDVIIMPETFLQIIDNYSAGLPVVIFNQNGSYSFGLQSSKAILKPSVTISRYKSAGIVHVLCVSRYDLDLLVNGFMLGESKVSCIRNGIEDICVPLGKKRKQIAYMPRKNTIDSLATISLLRAQPWCSNWDFVEVSGCSHVDVIEIFRKSVIFLSFGHPEGFGLPVAEAMACGCAVVGYSGLGGRELFSIGERFGIAKEVSVGDWPCFLRSVQEIDFLLNQDLNRFTDSLMLLSREIRQLYSFAEMIISVRLALERIEAAVAI
jgi:glycosyltransferase involved in cell wall biosynthesis